MPENEYFSDGMTEELISKLSRLHDLTVIARTSIMQYKGTGKNIAEIGRELRAGTILEGSVRKAGDRLRITAQLVDVANQGHLWSQDYDRTLDDVFAIQSDVAQHVAQALQITLKPAEQRRSGRQVRTTRRRTKPTSRASTTTIRGRSRVWRRALSTSSRRSRAIPASPRLTRPWHFLTSRWPRMAICRWTKRFQRSRRQHGGRWRSMRRTPEAWTALAVAASYYDYDWIRAEEGFRRALELNPNSVAAHDWYCAYLPQPAGPP